jgi:Leucine-rich repeat (LRR) protein
MFLINFFLSIYHVFVLETMAAVITGKKARVTSSSSSATVMASTSLLCAAPLVLYTHVGTFLDLASFTALALASQWCYKAQQPFKPEAVVITDMTEEKKCLSVSRFKQWIVEQRHARPISFLLLPYLQMESRSSSTPLVCRPSPLLGFTRLTLLRLGLELHDIDGDDDEVLLKLVPLQLYAHLESLLSLRHFRGRVPLRCLHHLPCSLVTLDTMLIEASMNEAPDSEWWESLFKRSKLEFLSLVWVCPMDEEDEAPVWWETSRWWLQRLCTSLTNLKQLELVYLPISTDDSCFHHLTALTKLTLCCSNPRLDHALPRTVSLIPQLRRLTLERFQCSHAHEAKQLLTSHLEQLTFFECDMEAEFFDGLSTQGAQCLSLHTLKFVGSTMYNVDSPSLLGSFRSLRHLRLQELNDDTLIHLPHLPELRRIDCCLQLQQTPVLPDDPLMTKLKLHFPLLESASCTDRK